MEQRPRKVWVGIDAGKAHHWATAVDDAGTTVWSKKIANDEPAVLDALGEILALADEAVWGIDISGTASALLLALLAAHGQQPLYVPGRTVNRMSAAYRGEAKTDARDAYVIAETVRHRTDFAPIDVPAETVRALAVLTAYRNDLTADRVRAINRMRDALCSIFPALERAFDYSGAKGPVVLLTGFQTPRGLRKIGRARLETWLRKRQVRSAEAIAATAMEAAASQRTQVPGEAVTASIVAELARQILDLDERLKDTERQIRETFRELDAAKIIESVPGFGPILGAEFVAATGDLTAYRDAGHLASAAGLVPVPRDSGRRTGNLHRPKRYNRALRRVFFMSALSSIRSDGPNREFYQKKRAEGLKHVQAVIALARRRVSVLWALLRDGRVFTPVPPVPMAA
ncbi:IS110 family transposase [Nocardiopsis synnemataformans]|uniref:IS110 family transposase n=1 Tax=Nocardiopsis synnemataformans TaxID=61305 RepID=UPI003EC030C1